jgi:integrase
MVAQIVESPNPFEYLGGHETEGVKGARWDIQTRYPHLVENDTVHRWLRKRQPTTKVQYLFQFDKFLAWAKSEISAEGPDQFLQWAKRQPDTLTVQQLIDDYADTLKPSVGQFATALLRSFLARNGYSSLPRIDWNTTMSFTEGFKRADIQHLLEYLDDPLQKLYVIIGKDSGLRANDLLYLRYKHLQEDLESGQKFVHIRFEKERYLRRKAPGRTFIGPNSTGLLNRLIKAGIISKDPEAKIFPWIYSGITASIGRARTKANLDPQVQPSHGLRKFFEACLDRVGMDHHKKMLIEGHGNGVRTAYTSRDVVELRKLYEQAYRFLDLSEEAVVDQTVLDLKTTVDHLTKKLTEKDDEIKDLRDELSSQRELESTVREYLPLLKALSKDPEIMKRLASLKT